MKVKNLIKKLLDYNMDADIAPLAHSRPQPFSVSFGGSDGCSKESCDYVYIDCDDLNQNESAG